MKYEISFPHNESSSVINRRRVTSYTPVYTVAQLEQLEALVQAALAEKFVSFTAEITDKATNVSIEWNEVDQAAEVAAIDGAFAAWSEAMQGEGG